MKIFEDCEANVTFYLRKLKTHESMRVIVGDKVKSGELEIKEVFEKPPKFLSNLATGASYVSKLKIYRAIKKTELNIGGEVQLANVISLLLNWWMLFTP
jgi:UTP-glucose-1-phosphate uridylyltransferase